MLQAFVYKVEGFEIFLVNGQMKMDGGHLTYCLLVDIL